MLCCAMVPVMIAGCGNSSDETAEASAATEEAAADVSAEAEVADAEEEADPNVTSSSEIKDAADLKIGLSIHFKTDDYGVVCSDAFEARCEEYGIGEYKVLDANSDASQQLADIETFIAEGYDAIVVSPVDDAAVKDVINEATDQGIEVVTITHVPDANVLCNISAGNYDFSCEVCEKLCEAMDYQGKVALLDITTNLWRTNQRLQAFEDTIAQYPDMEIVATELAMTPDEAKTVAENILTANPDLGGIFGTFSNVTYGAAAAAKDAGRDDLILGGVDADMSILNLMQEGWVQAAAAQIPNTHSELAVDALMKYYSGEEIEDEYAAEYKIYVQGEEEQCAEEVWGKSLSDYTEE